MAATKDSIKQKDGKNNNWENRTSGYRDPSWYANIEEPIKFAKLTTDISSSAKVDVVIVGGELLVWLQHTCFQNLVKGYCNWDDGYIASGETSRTTAHITHALDDRYYNLEKIHGKHGSQMAAESHTAAINLVESIVNEKKIDCDFERLDGFLFLHPSDNKRSLFL